MKVEQLYTPCLAEAAYLVVSGSEAAVIDPLRDTQPYIDLATKHGATIKYIFETHFHADFVSGHLDLARQTGAQIVYGPTACPEFDAHVASDGEIFQLGDVQFKLLHTPGHTLESSTLLLINERGVDHAIFTGDTLFLGDVGRPDLAVKSDLSREDLAGLLFDSLRQKIMPLGDEVVVYPGHGQGSACGKHMSNETVDKLGSQKKNNYALNPTLSKDEFVKLVTDGLVAPPQYFPKNAVLNKKGYQSLSTILEKGLRPLVPHMFEYTAIKEKALMLDTRSPAAFARGHIPGSLFIGIEGSFAPWVGALIKDLRQPIVFVADEGREAEVVKRLSRVGYDNTLGFLKGGIREWESIGKPIAKVEEVRPKDFADVPDHLVRLIDVRKTSEYNTQHIVGARSFPLATLQEDLWELNRAENYYLHCAGGYRSMIACSILLAAGYQRIVNIQQGFAGLKEENVTLSEFHEQLSML